MTTGWFMKTVWIVMEVNKPSIIKICATRERAEECVNELLQDHLGTTRDEYAIGEYELD